MNAASATKAVASAAQHAVRTPHALFRIPRPQRPPPAQRRCLHSRPSPLRQHLANTPPRAQRRHESTTTTPTAPRLTPAQPAEQQQPHPLPQDPLPAPRQPSAPQQQPRITDSVPSYRLTCTCSKCQARSSHRITQQAYHHGTVLVTCPGCKNRHLISDNLKIFSDKRVTLEDIMREKGQLVRRGVVGGEGDVEFWGEDKGVKGEEGKEEA